MDRTSITIRIEEDLKRALDDWRKTQTVTPSLNATVIAALKAWLDWSPDQPDDNSVTNL